MALSQTQIGIFYKDVPQRPFINWILDVCTCRMRVGKSFGNFLHIRNIVKPLLFKGNTYVHHPAKQVRCSPNDNDDSDLSETNVAIETQLSSATTASTCSDASCELESDMHDIHTNDSSFTDSDQEAANTPLYDGSSLSAKNFNGMFYALIQKHNLSSQAKDSILKLLRLSLPKGNKCPASVYQFEKSLIDLGYNYRKHITCWKCQHSLREGDICVNNQCANVGTQGKGFVCRMFSPVNIFVHIK